MCDAALRSRAIFGILHPNLMLPTPAAHLRHGKTRPVGTRYMIQRIYVGVFVYKLVLALVQIVDTGENAWQQPLRTLGRCESSEFCVAMLPRV